MNQTKSIKSLFGQNPRSWGLRGDPHLWDEMKSHFEGVPLPASTQELTALVEEAFLSLTDHSLSEVDAFFIERFSHGGMSSGYISPQFWNETAVPLLCERFEKLHTQ